MRLSGAVRVANISHRGDSAHRRTVCACCNRWNGHCAGRSVYHVCQLLQAPAEGAVGVCDYGDQFKGAPHVRWSRGRSAERV